MSRVRDMALQIVRREGGFVDHPDDPGGATKYGVSLAWARRIGLDIDHDGDVDADDIRAITPEQAADLFVQYFFEAPGLNELPEDLHDVMFDTAVLFGPAGAVRILQTALRKAGMDIAVDGLLGPQTISAARAVAARGGEAALLLREAVLIERAEEHKRRARRRPKLRVFLRGWLNRCALLAKDTRTIDAIWRDVDL